MHFVRSSVLTSAFAAALLVYPACGATRTSSGGYSRPSTPAPFRPSISAVPSTSGGYSRPSTTSAVVAAPKATAGDRTITQSSSGDALRAFRSGTSGDVAAPRKRPGFLPSGNTPSPPIAVPTHAPATTTVIVNHELYLSQDKCIHPTHQAWRNKEMLQERRLIFGAFRSNAYTAGES